MGLLSAFLGGMADTGQRMLQHDQDLEDKRVANEQLLERQTKLEQMKEAAAERRAQLAQQYKEEAEDRKRRQLIDDNAKAMQQAEEIGTDRRYSKFRDDMRNAGYGEGMSEDEIKNLYKEQYDNKNVTDEAGGDRYVDKNRTDSASDFVKASRGTGNTGLIDYAEKQYQQSRIADSEESKAKIAERNASVREKAADARITAATASTGAAVSSLAERLKQQERETSRKSTEEELKSIEQELKGFNVPNGKERKDAWDQTEKGKRYAELVKQRDEARSHLRSFRTSPATATAGKKSSGDPASGSGVVSPQDNETALDELQKQREALFALHQQNPTKDNEKALEYFDRLIRERQTSAPSKSDAPKAKSDSLPAGSKFIGREKGTGRPVYELPDGSRVVQK